MMLTGRPSVKAVGFLVSSAGRAGSPARAMGARVVSQHIRRYERIDASLPCRLYIPEAGKGDGLRFEAFVSTRNVGLGGVFVESTFLMKPGLELRVDLTLPSAVLRVRGRIVHVVGLDDEVYPSGMGIEFLEMDSAGRETFMRDFAPARYRGFYDATLAEFPHVEELYGLEDVCLLLNLWEEWKTVQEGGPRATESGAPTPTPKARPRGR